MAIGRKLLQAAVTAVKIMKRDYGIECAPEERRKLEQQRDAGVPETGDICAAVGIKGPVMRRLR